MIHPNSIYTEADRQKVIDYYLSRSNNTVPEICSNLGYKKSFVNSALNRYFKEKLKNKNKQP